MTKTSRGVVEISPADETDIGVVEVGLDVRGWQTCLEQQPPKPRLHRRFGGLREHRKRAQLVAAGKRCPVDEFQTDSGVDGNQRCDLRYAKCGVAQRSI